MHEMMERQLNHLVRLVDDLLEVSRIEHGAREVRYEPADEAARSGSEPIDAEAPLRSSEEAGARSIAGRRILVVDDNRDAAESLRMMLELLGAEVHVAYDGRAALAKFAELKPAAVLLDIGMPEMNGYEVARAIRTRFAGHPARIVALTGWGQENDRRRSREAGFDHHLVKPADLRALERALAA